MRLERPKDQDGLAAESGVASAWWFLVGNGIGPRLSEGSARPRALATGGHVRAEELNSKRLVS